MSTPKIDFGNWHSKIGTSAENSPNREAPNKHNMGAKKYKEMISRDTKRIDSQGNMPFTFSKPSKGTKHREDIYHMCDKCTHISFVSKYRAGQVCSSCKGYCSVNSSNTFLTEDSLDAKLRSLSETDD